jgi:hypothetical protein
MPTETFSTQQLNRATGDEGFRIYPTLLVYLNMNIQLSVTIHTILRQHGGTSTETAKVMRRSTHN